MGRASDRLDMDADRLDDREWQMTDLDACSYCGRIFEAAEIEEFRRSDSKQRLLLPRHDQIYAVVPLASGERTVCEDCFLSGAVGPLGDAEYSELHYQFGLEYSHKERYEQARACFEKAVQRSRSPDHLVGLSLAHENLNDAERALECLEEARRIEPDNRALLRSLPRLYVKCGRFADAVAQIESTWDQLVGPDVFLDGAEALVRLGRRADAERMYETALEIATACCEDHRRECEERWRSICAICDG